jgi:hypothetical protein
MRTYLNKGLKNLVKIPDVAVRKGVYSHSTLSQAFINRRHLPISSEQDVLELSICLPTRLDGSMVRRHLSKALLGPKL